MWPRSMERNGRIRPGLIDALERVLEGGISLPYDARAASRRVPGRGERMVITSMRVQTRGRWEDGPEERER